MQRRENIHQTEPDFTRGTVLELINPWSFVTKHFIEVPSSQNFESSIRTLWIRWKVFR